MASPFYNTPDLPNFRSLAGLKTQNGTSVRSNLIYRSAAPKHANETTSQVLHALGITTFYDLRSAAEIERLKKRTPIVEFPNTTRVFAPVFDADHGSPEIMASRMAAYSEVGPDGFVRAYEEILQCGGDAYRRIFTHIRDEPHRPFIVHCTAGKDRTGVAIMLALSLVGVSDQDIAAEYHLTEEGLKDDVEVWVPLLLHDPVFNGDEKAVRRALGARKESMLGSLDMLRTKFGGAQGYLMKNLGFTEQDVEVIKRNLLVDSS